MFVVKPTDMHDVMATLGLLAHYDVKVTVISQDPDSIKPSNYSFVVDSDGDEGELRLAEMSFQMNFRQKGKVCIICKDEDEGKEFCGHLTFTSKIDSRF